MDWFFSQEDLHYYSLDFDLKIWLLEHEQFREKGFRPFIFNNKSVTRVNIKLLRLTGILEVYLPLRRGWKLLASK